MAINISDFDKIWASTSPLTPYAFTDANYQQGWNFVGATPPARQMWDSYMKWSDEKQQYIVNNFLPLSGGTMTGKILGTGGVLGNANDTDKMFILGGTSTTDSPSIMMSPKNGDDGGVIQLQARNGSTFVNLNAFPNGTLTWGGVSLTDGSFLTTASVSVNASSGTASYTIAAPAVSGYQFICWYMSASNGNVYPTYISASNTSSTKVWAVNPTNNTTIVCFALYVRKW